MRILNLTEQNTRELASRFRKHAYEQTDDGRIFVPKMGLFIGGSVRHWVNDEDPAIDANLFTTEGMTDVLSVVFDQGAATATYYIAPYSGNVTPLVTWTASGAGGTPIFTSAATELTTQYTQATRVAWVTGAAAAASVGNTASPAAFTIAAGGADIRGIGLLTVATKGAVTGKAMAVANLTAARLGLIEADTFRMEYVVAAQNA